MKMGTKAGDSGSTFELTLLYINGWGVEKDVAKGFSLLDKSTKAGDIVFMVRLAELYASRKDVVEVNLEKTMHYYLMAVEKDSLSARLCVGKAYYRGAGVEQDLEKAFYWFNINSKLNDAQSALGEIFLNGQVVPVDYKLANKWIGESIKDHHIHGYYHKGRVYKEGLGVRKNAKKVFKSYEKSANLGHSYA